MILGDINLQDPSKIVDFRRYWGMLDFQILQKSLIFNDSGGYQPSKSFKNRCFSVFFGRQQPTVHKLSLVSITSPVDPFYRPQMSLVSITSPVSPFYRPQLSLVSITSPVGPIYTHFVRLNLYYCSCCGSCPPVPAWPQGLRVRRYNTKFMHYEIFLLKC